MWRYGWLILLVSLLGCQPKYSENLNIHAKISFDQSFTQQEKDLIIKALNEWNDETYQIFSWSFSDYEGCSFSIYFDKKSINEEIIKDKLNYYGKDLRGFSSKHSDPCQPGSINLIVDNMDNEHQYYIVTLHEIGHQLNLKHSNHPFSIMNSSTAQSLPGLQKEDIKQFLLKNLKSN